MTAEEARRHIQYSTWASRKLLDAALKLDAEQLHRDMRISHKSVHATLDHILFGDRIWLSRVVGEPIEPEGSLEVEWPKIRDRWEATVAGWNDADLARVINFTRPNGDQHSALTQDVVLHVVNHATLHRGQVMAMLRQFGIVPPSTDLLHFLREKQSAHA